MQFNDFCEVIKEVSELEHVEMKEDSIFKDDLAIDSLQMVNLLIGIAQRYAIPFEKFIISERIATVGELFEIVKGER